MQNFKVLFNTRNQKRSPAFEFVVPAPSSQEAEMMARQWLLKSGQSLIHFKKPQVRPLSATEQERGSEHVIASRNDSPVPSIDRERGSS